MVTLTQFKNRFIHSFLDWGKSLCRVWTCNVSVPLLHYTVIAATLLCRAPLPDFMPLFTGTSQTTPIRSYVFIFASTFPDSIYFSCKCHNNIVITSNYENGTSLYKFWTCLQTHTLEFHLNTWMLYRVGLLDIRNFYPCTVSTHKTFTD